MRRYRYAFFLLSVLIAFVLHALFFYLAPQIVLLRKPEAKASEIRPILLALRPASASSPESPSSRVLATRPGTVSDLVKRDEDPVSPDTSLVEPFKPLPEVASRIGEDAIAREHDLSPDPDMLKKADARIVEIAVEDARTQVDVARRLVRPSPDRLLDPNAIPTLRVPDAGGNALPEVSSLGRSILSEGTAMPAVESLPPLASAPGAATTAPADLPSLKLPAPALSRAVEEAKQESAYTFLDDLLDLRLDAYQPDPNQPGYFRLRIFPRQDAEIQPIKKEVTFVIDASQSIPQHKLRATAKGVAAGLRMLRPEDTMNVVVFRNTNQLLRPTPEPATKELMAEATVLLTGLEAKGETDVYQALQPLMQTAPPAGYPSLIILLSDGRPTTGMQDSRTLINSLAADNRLRNTVFTYGSGNSVNRGLLDLLAYRNKGASRVIDDIDAVEKDLPAFLEQLSAPVLVDCKAEFAGMDPGEIFPKNLTDLYLQRPIIIYGRYTPGSAERLVVRVTGRAGEVPKEVVFEAAFKEAQSADAAVANGWAFEKAYHLIGEISRSGETPELIEALRSLSAQYGIKTSYD